MFIVGVGISDFKPTLSDEVASKNSVCIDGDGWLYCDGKKQNMHFKLQTGQSITVLKRGEMIIWFIDGD